MDRRRFLQSALATGVYTTSSAAGLLPNISYAADGFAAVNQKMLAMVRLGGGPDFRHLLPPAYEQDTLSFGYRYWNATASAHGFGNFSQDNLSQRWQNEYTANDAGNGQTFGILNKCGWLQSMWDQGKVAIVSNVFGVTSRDHAHGLQVLDQGLSANSLLDLSQAGWGGRLADTLNANIVSLTNIPKRFCFSVDPNNPLQSNTSRMISASDSRNLKLYNAEESTYWRQLATTRSAIANYRSKSLSLPQNSIYRRFLEIEEKLRTFGDPVDARLQTVPIPASIEQLYDQDTATLGNRSFGYQIRGLYDTLAANDILNMRIASLEYGGWDSHNLQKDSIEPKLEDLFGNGKAFDTLYSELPLDARENLVLVFAGEFGRQIKANGDFGTDHGKGNTVLLVGDSIQGGVYGNMFPESELPRLEEASPDITGLTAMDRVFANVADNISAGAALSVFPNYQSTELEIGVELNDAWLK